jgi:DNA invertase Pin-like site-specific DNA recombinase
VSHQEALDSSTPMAKAMFTITPAMAELDRGIIRERVIAGLEHARQHRTKSGKPIGRPRAVFRRDLVAELAGVAILGAEIARRCGPRHNVHSIPRTEIQLLDFCSMYWETLLSLNGS